MRGSPDSSNSNRLLAALAPSDLARLAPHLELVSLLLRDVLSEPGKPIQWVYFPVRGFVSLVRPMADKSMVEVGLIGREGAVGSSILLGASTTPVMAMVQASGAALRIPASILLREAGGSGGLTTVLLRSVHALHIQVTQTAACNGRHALPKRLARWLLMAQDRLESDEITLSHELLSMMLGSRRAGITVALGALKQAGYIDTAHRRVTVLDRQGLETAACECYRAVRDEDERLLSQL